MVTVLAQGDVVWIAFPTPIGSEPGFERPAVVVQSDSFNRSQLNTVVVVPLTSNLNREGIPGNVKLKPRDGLKKPSVATVVHIGSVDRAWIKRRIARISTQELESIIDGVNVMMGRPH